MGRGYRFVLTDLQALLFPHKDCLNGRRFGYTYFSHFVFLLWFQYNNNLQILTNTFGCLIQTPELAAAAALVVFGAATITASCPTSSEQPSSFEQLLVQRPRN